MPSSESSQRHRYRNRSTTTTRSATLVALLIWLCMGTVGCQQVRLPAIDPSGDRVFLSNQQTTIAGNPTPSAGIGLLEPAFVRPEMPPPCPEMYGNVAGPPSPGPNGPGFIGPRANVREGEIVLTPTKVIAPINSDVVVFGGLCAADGYFRKRQRLEWSLSQESVGHFVEVREGSLRRLRRVLGNETGKQGINYAIGYTSSADETITRGTPTVVDDLLNHSGQGWVSVTSPSEGTSYVDCMAPKAEGWDRRRQTATIHWIDAHWEFPPNVTVPAGSTHQLMTLVRRASTPDPVSDWIVNYTILNGSVQSGFLPAQATSAEGIRTNSLGQATVSLQQPPNSFGPGLTQVRVDIIRPGRSPSDPDRLQVASSVVNIQWTAPALTMVASGPETVGIDTAFQYRVEVSNPGDQVASQVTLNAILPPGLTLISSSPQAEFAGGTARIPLGDIAPGPAVRVIEFTVKANNRGTHRPCFQVQSTDSRLRPLERCLETTVSVPCLGMQIQGPSEARVGEAVTYLIRIQNQCDETLRNIQLVDTYSDGLEAPDLTSPLIHDPFDLEPGTFRDIEITFVIRTAGEHCQLIQVTADGGHLAESRQCVVATEAERKSLSLNVETFAQEVTVDNQFLVRATLVNDGNVPLPEMTVLYDASPSLAYDLATDGKRVVENGLQWRLAQMPPGAQVVLEVVARGTIADPAAMVRFTSFMDDGSQVEDSSSVRVSPIPERPQPQFDGGPQRPDDDVEIVDPFRSNRLVLSTRLLDQPISVGDQATVTVTVKNDRAVSDRNLVLVFTMPDGVRFVGTGPNSPLVVNDRSSDGRTIVMQARRELRADDSFGLNFVVEAIAAGSQEIGISISSDREPDGVREPVTAIVNLR